MQVSGRKQVWYWGIAAAVLMLVLWQLGSTLTPFLIGAAIAYLLNPIADWLERRGLSRVWATALITLSVALLIVAALLGIIPLLSRQFGQLIQTAPEIFNRLQSFLGDRFPELLDDQSPVRETLANLGHTISQRGGELAGIVLGSVMNVLSVVMIIVIVPVVAFYLLLDWNNMLDRVDSLLPRDHAPTIRRLAREIDEALGGFLRGEGMVMTILSVFYATGLLLVGLPFALLVGVVAGMLTFIPYVGTIIGGVTSIGLALFAFWGDPVMIGIVVAIFVAGQMLESNYLVPKLVGHHVGLHPVWLLLALSVFGSLFGFAGMLVAVPVAAALGVLVRYAAEQYRESGLYTGREMPAPPQCPTLIEIVPPGTVERERRQAERAAEQRINEVRIDEMIEERAKQDET
ncbi:MAG: AI-2E family transporter [Paracoccus sp. (in: a-proteobacteria)]|uniref:AI-2E family transporter n=1 Tax=Paracoccus sp. TaxID=267 RepID=UPI0026E08EC4|nr:AI-2E family transporter [Paracoccus sp. (in: a-proteobacteria)]MDO5631520.1 AI-2E family transporter [Paracoccus sp. (in: a-proteobacteria)]